MEKDLGVFIFKSSGVWEFYLWHGMSTYFFLSSLKMESMKMMEENKYLGSSCKGLNVLGGIYWYAFDVEKLYLK